MKSEDSPITTNSVLKIGGAAFAMISGLISVSLYIGSLKSDIIRLQEANQTYTKATDARFAEIEKQLDRLRTHSEQTDRTVEQIERKLDVAVSILERIDKKVNP
jgi:flavin-dependent dehydrogenase